MADHRLTCPRCAGFADTEEQLRRDWRALAAPAAPDFWPRIALRLEDQRSVQSHPSRTAARRTWAWGGTALLTATAISGLLLWPKPISTTQHGEEPRTVLVRPTSVSALPDVSRVDPTVDDPAGTSMENVWTQINATTPGDASR